MTKKKLLFGVVGLGLQGRRMIQAMKSAKHAELAGTASRHTGESFSALLKKDMDAVLISTPNDKHSKQIIAAANAGKHILCEKPLALSLREARAIAQAVKKNRVKCFVNYHLRMHPEAQKAKRLIAQKKPGDITYIEMHWSIGGLAQKTIPTLPLHMRWRESPSQAGGGALMARGVHLFDLLRFITGREISEVRAWSDATSTAVDRTAIGVFLLDSDVPVVITTSKSIVDSDNHIAIHGTRGKLILRDLFTSDPHTMYVATIDAFADALRGKKTSLATLDDGIATIEITEAFISSTKHKGAEVTVQ